MKCENIKLAVHNYYANIAEANNDESIANNKDSIDKHLSQCDSCQFFYKQHKTLQIQLAAIPRSKAPDTLKQKILADRVAQQDKKRHQRTVYLSMAASVCLAVLITFAINFGNQSEDSKHNEMVASTSITTTQSSISTIKNQPSQVNFLVYSEQIIDNVTFTVSVPAQMVLYGYNGRNTLSWSGKLKQGKNLLTVPVMALSEQNGVLVMKITHKNAIKEYRVAVNVQQNRVMAPIWTSGQLS